jgi:hypothetical protein
VYIGASSYKYSIQDLITQPRFNIVESSLAAGFEAEVQIVLDVLVVVSPETADR